MKIEKVRIQNFRSFKDETIFLSDYTCLVGPNGCGKSTVLTALNIFFRAKENVATDLINLSKEDFYNQQIEEPIFITVTFKDLTDEAKAELKHYVRQDLLVVSAIGVWNEQTQTAEVIQHGERMGIKEFATYFDLDKNGASAEELNIFYSEVLQSKFTDLSSARSKADKKAALLDYESQHLEQCELILSKDEFYGASKGVNKIEKYLQWVYVPAVKDIATEQADSKNSAIGKLLAHRVHAQLGLDEPINILRNETAEKYQVLLDSQQDKLTAVSSSLTARLNRWAHANAALDLQWQDQQKAVNIAKPFAEMKASEGIFKGDLTRFGHGLQRSIIFALLEELAEYKIDGPVLILACEEPELYQHPPQARYIMSVLRKLSSENSQILICSHSPYFVSGESFEDIRLLRKNSDGSVSAKQALASEVSRRITTASGQTPAKPGAMIAKIDQAMLTSINEMFFCDFRVFVEGLEDVAYISSYLVLSDQADTFRSLGGGLIPVNGKHHLIQTLAIANELAMPYYVVFDCDGNTPVDDPSDPTKQTGRRQKHEKDNLAILKLAGSATTSAFPNSPIRDSNLAAWPNTLSEVVILEIGSEKWTAISQTVRNTYGINTGDMGKNSLFIGYVLAEAWAQGLKSATLLSVCEDILKHQEPLQ